MKDVPGVIAEEIYNLFINSESVTLTSEPASKTTKLTKHFYTEENIFYQMWFILKMILISV